MRKNRRWLTIPVTLGLMTWIGIGLRGDQADNPKRLTADDVIELWKPKLEGTTDLHMLGASPEKCPGVAAWTFRAVGPSFETAWNHYADLCGIKDRYQPKQFLISGAASDKGCYVVSDRWSSREKGDRGVTVFLLKADRYTVTVTIQPDPDEQGVRGSIAAVVP